MPISRTFFQHELRHRHDVRVSDLDDKWNDSDSREKIARGNLVASGADRTAGANSEDDFAEKEFQAAHSLPPAVAPSAGNRDAIGQTQPKTKAHRSVAPGSDAPYALEGPGTVGETVGMAVVPKDGSGGKEKERNRDSLDAVESGMERYHAETLAAGERAMRLRSIHADHLDRIHEVVGRLVELMETHSADHGAKLQILEQRLAQLEMRMATNRMSQ
jgi:hypothetical protein